MKYKLPALLLTMILLFALVPAAFADEGEGEEINVYCMDTSLLHPVGSRIADRYAVTYEWVMKQFCEFHFGFGEIMLALQTSKIMNPDPPAGFDLEAYAKMLLDAKTELDGWGQVWKSLGFTGRPKGNDWAGGPPAWAGPKDKDSEGYSGVGPPPWAGPKDKDSEGSSSVGPPTWAGPKDWDAEDDDDSGPPPWAGPKDNDRSPGPPAWAGPKNKPAKP